MDKILPAIIAGALFGLGLAVSEMMDPAKVLGFLDLFGVWDPTLVFVLVGALCVTTPGFWLVRKRPGPMLGGGFQLPTRKDIDRPLILGATIFGVGWGLAGFCPGPALAALSTGLVSVVWFVVAMIVGMVLHKVTLGR